MFAERLQQVGRTRVRSGRRELIYFAGCDYLRLASDPRVLAAVEDGLKTYGLNVAASRKTTGNHALYEKLEAKAVRFFETDQAVLVSNGYLTNLAAAQGLAGQITHALLDERAHSSLKDAAGILGASVHSFRHRDPRSLQTLLRRLKNPAQAAILTDGMFAHDGSVAPLAEYYKIAPDTLLWVDDSHAAGILGRHGRGTVELSGISREQVLQTVTFSKAFGVYGGAILGERQLCEAVIERSGIAVGNTPLPLPLAAGVLKALSILRGKILRERLWRNVQHFHNQSGLPAPTTLSPIIAITPGSPEEATRLAKHLRSEGIYPSLIQYPGGSDQGYFRFALSSEHSLHEISLLASCIRNTLSLPSPLANQRLRAAQVGK